MANIDPELSFLKNALDGDAKLAREAISNALLTIDQDRAYQYKKLVVTEDGEYIADEDEAFSNVVVNVKENDAGPMINGIASRFKVTKNGIYLAKDMFGDGYIINEFDVDVDQIIREKKQINITKNGEYDAFETECYNPIIVDIENTHHEGDLLEPSFYYTTPGNPNFDANQYIFTDHGVLFGTRAGLIFRRLPKLDDIVYNGKTYIQDTWNPGIDAYNGLTLDQQFMPTWNLPPNGYSRPLHKTVYFDADVFAAVSYNKAMKWFIKPNDTVIINGIGAKFKYIADEYAGIEHTFWEWINLDEMVNIHYASSDTLLNTRDVINSDDDYYCWKHSYARALLNNSNEDLECTYDINSFTSNVVRNILGSDIYDSIHPFTHNVNYAQKRNTNSPYYKCKIYKFYEDYTESSGYNYIYIAPEDIPVNPKTGERDPFNAGLYELQEEYGHTGIVKTRDDTIVSGKSYYQYEYSPEDPEQKGINISNPYYANYIGMYNYDHSPLPDLNYEIGISNPEHNLRAKMAFIENNKVYRFNFSGNSVVKTTEYTLDNHVNFLMQHGEWEKISFHDLDTFIIDADFDEKFVLKYGRSESAYGLAAAITPYDLNIPLYKLQIRTNPDTGINMEVYIKCIDGRLLAQHSYINDDNIISGGMASARWVAYINGIPDYLTTYKYIGSSSIGDEVWENDPEFANFQSFTAKDYNFDPRIIKGIYDKTKGNFTYTDSKSFKVLDDLKHFTVTDNTWQYIPVENPPSDPGDPYEAEEYARMIFEYNDELGDYCITQDHEIVEGKTYYSDTKYAFAHIKIKRLAKIDLTSVRFTLTEKYRIHSPILYNTDDIHDVSIWRNYGLEQYYPGYESDIWPFEDGLNDINKTSNDDLDSRYSYYNPKHFLSTENSVYVNVNGQTNKLFVEKSLYRDPRYTDPLQPLTYRWYEIRSGQNPANGINEYRIKVLARTKDYLHDIPYEENFIIKVEEYEAGWDSLDIWDVAFNGLDPDEYLETKKTFWPSSNITDLSLRINDQWLQNSKYGTDLIPGTSYYNNLYYCDSEEMWEYNNTQTGERTYHVEWYKRYGDTLMQRPGNERIEPVESDMYFCYVKWKTLTHTEYRRRTSDEWQVRYDDGAADIWEVYKESDNSYSFIKWDLNRVAEYITDLYTYSEYLSNVPKSYPYRRKKLIDHSYVENGDVFTDEPYYEVILNPITVSNPFDDAEYLNLDQIHDDIYVPTKLASPDDYCFYDINDILTYYGEYPVYKFGDIGEQYPNGSYELYSYKPYNDIYYHDNKGEDPIYINNDIEYMCEEVTDKFALSTDIWDSGARLYQTFGVGFSDDEKAFDTSNEYDMRLYMHDFYGIGTPSLPKREKSSYTQISHHVNANAAYRYSSKENYINGHYRERVEHFYYNLDPTEQYDHLRANETEAHEILSELDNEYDTIITQKKYELQGSFDASTGSSQIKHAYFFL